MKIKNTITLNDGRRMVCRIFDAKIDKMYYDNESKPPFDRFTVAFKGYRVKNWGMVYPYIASSENPFHPLGFGQHGESREFLTGKHLGKRISFESLPVDVQSFVLQQFD